MRKLTLLLTLLLAVTLIAWSETGKIRLSISYKLSKLNTSLAEFSMSAPELTLRYTLFKDEKRALALSLSHFQGCGDIRINNGVLNSKLTDDRFSVLYEMRKQNLTLGLTYRDLSLHSSFANNVFFTSSENRWRGVGATAIYSFQTPFSLPFKHPLKISLGVSYFPSLTTISASGDYSSLEYELSLGWELDDSFTLQLFYQSETFSPKGNVSEMRLSGYGFSMGFKL